MRTDDLPEIIEIIDDDTGAFGDRSLPGTTHDKGGPRWVGPVAAVALVGLIGYGVVTSTSRAPKALPVTSTTAVTQTTQPAPTTTLPPTPPVPYFAASPPREFRVQFADLQYDDSVSYGLGYQLWAATNSAAPYENWFSITDWNGQANLAMQNAYRLVTDRGSLAVSHTTTGQSLAQYSTNHHSVMLRATGWSDDDLVRLAESIDLDTPEPTLTDRSLIPGYELISTGEPWGIVQGNPVEQVYYASSVDLASGFGIIIATLDTDAARNGPVLDRQGALRFLLDHSTPFTVDGHPAVAGGVVDQPGYSLATWTVGNHSVTVAGGLTVAQLVAVARTVHEVSANEWRGMQFQATQNSREGQNDNTTYNEHKPVPVSFGTDSQGDTWIIRAALASYGTFRQVSWNWYSNGTFTSLDDTLQINTYVDNDRTYVLVDLPRSVAGAAELHVTRGGLEPVVVQFNDIDPTLDRTFAAYAFSETGPYTAQVVGADGTVLGTWPAP